MSAVDILLLASAGFVIHMVLMIVYSMHPFSRKFLIFLGASIGFVLGIWMVFLLGIHRLPFALSFIMIFASVMVSIQLVWLYSGLSKARKRQ